MHWAEMVLLIVLYHLTLAVKFNETFVWVMSTRSMCVLSYILIGDLS